MIDIIVYLNANKDCDPNIVEFTVHPCHYKQNGNYHRQQHSKNCQEKKNKKRNLSFCSNFSFIKTNEKKTTT